MKKILIKIAPVLVLAFLLSSFVYAGPGKPFEYLQQQIDDIFERLEYLESLHGPRFTDMGNGTIRDNKTGLIWLKNANCFVYQPWQESMDAAALLENGDCGLTDGSAAGDWRLPTMDEVEVFISPIYDLPALVNTMGDLQWKEGDAFTGVKTTQYWSSTEYDSNSAYVAELAYGSLYYHCLKDTNRLVWPVRSGDD